MRDHVRHIGGGLLALYEGDTFVREIGVTLGWDFRDRDEFIARYNATLPAAEPADAGRDAAIRLVIIGDVGGIQGVRQWDNIGELPAGEYFLSIARPTSVDDAMVDAALNEFFEPHDEGHDETIRRLMRAALTAALASQQAVKP